MRTRTRNLTDNQNLDVYPSFTDLMANAFMIMSLLLLLALFQSFKLNQDLQKSNEKLKAANPIIIDEKSGNFKFQSGSAELSPDLKEYIEKKIIPDIEDILEEKKETIDFIQVIGHTDGVPVGKTGNLDQNVEKAAQNRVEVADLIPGSNADLALLRALAVVQELQKQKQFQNVKFRAYSAGQLYLSSGELAPLNRRDDETRRRIEIRFIPPIPSPK